MWDLILTVLLLGIHQFLPGNWRERWTFSGSVILAGDHWVLVTSLLLHDGFPHLSNNVFFLIPVVTALEGSFCPGPLLVMVLLVGVSLLVSFVLSALYLN